MVFTTGTEIDCLIFADTSRPDRARLESADGIRLRQEVDYLDFLKLAGLMPCFFNRA